MSDKGLEDLKKTTNFITAAGLVVQANKKSLINISVRCQWVRNINTSLTFDRNFQNQSLNVFF